MRALIERLNREVDQPDQDTFVAVSTNRSDDDNLAIIATVREQLVRNPADPAPLLTDEFIAAVSALPPTVREREIGLLLADALQNTALRQRFNKRSFNRRIKEFAALADRVRSAREQIAGGDLRPVNRNHLEPIVRRFLESYHLDGIPRLRRRAGTWFIWNEGAYTTISDDVVKQMATDYLNTLRVFGPRGTAVPFAPDKKAVGDFLNQLSALTLIGDGTLDERWLDANERERPSVEECIVFSNAVLAVPWWLDERADSMLEPTPRLFVMNTLAVAYDPEATCPRFERFVAQLLGDPASVAAMQMTLGYLLTQNTGLQLVFILIGSSGSGKGTLMRIIQGLLGKRVSTPTGKSLSGDFGNSALLGKSVAIMTDLHHLGDRSHQVVELIRAISGQDPVDINRKNKEIITGQILCVRWILVMNEAVALPDVSGAMGRRYCVFTADRAKDGTEIKDLDKILLAEEGPGIINWALQGLKRMREIEQAAVANGKDGLAAVQAAMQPPSGLAKRKELIELGNPLLKFIRKEFVLGADQTVEFHFLFTSWETYCDQANMRPGTRDGFISNVLASVSGLTVEEPPPDKPFMQPRLRGMGWASQEQRTFTHMMGDAALAREVQERKAREQVNGGQPQPEGPTHG